MVPQLNSALIIYASMSGNTKEVADIIASELSNSGVTYVDVRRIEGGVLPKPRDFDAMIIGTYTWDKGATPEEVKDFAADLGYKPDNVYVFGTGDTQFGGDALFCKAADKLARFYETEYPVLKVEQSPRGTQEEVVRNWAQGIMERKR